MTTNAQGEGNDLGGVLQFRFGAGGFDMKVLEMSLKSLIETGKGAPDPHHIKIDNWNWRSAQSGKESVVSRMAAC